MESVQLECRSSVPVFDQAVEDIAALYLTREMVPGHEDDLDYIHQKTEEIDDAWRAEGFEGVHAFLTKDGQYVAIGRRLHEDERESYAAAWAAGSYPFLVDFNLHQREQTLRVMFGGEVRDVTIPAQFQPPGMHYRGFNGIDGITYLYRVGYDEPGLSENMAWLVELFGNSASLSYVHDHFISLSIHDYSNYRQLGNLFPSLENVAAKHDALKAERS